jgi:hypothetical protein
MLRPYKFNAGMDNVNSLFGGRVLGLPGTRVMPQFSGDTYRFRKAKSEYMSPNC